MVREKGSREKEEVEKEREKKGEDQEEMVPNMHRGHPAALSPHLL